MSLFPCSNISRICHIAFRKGFNPFLRVDVFCALSGYKSRQKKCLEILHGFAEDVVKQRIKTRKEKTQEGNKEEEEKEEEKVMGKSTLKDITITIYKLINLIEIF